MSYCPKCGNEINETMAFCPRCGTTLKGPPTDQTTPSQPNTLEKEMKKEKNQQPEKSEQDKTEHSFIGYLVGGLVLITIGVFALLELSGDFRSSGQGFAVMLLIIGIIVIVGAIYIALTSRKHTHEPN